MRARIRASHIKLKRMADQLTDVTEMAWLNGVTKQGTSRVKSPSFLLSLRNADHLWKQQKLADFRMQQLAQILSHRFFDNNWVYHSSTGYNKHAVFYESAAVALAVVPTKSQRRRFRQYYYSPHLFLFSNCSNIFLMFVLLLLLYY